MSRVTSLVDASLQYFHRLREMKAARNFGWMMLGQGLGTLMQAVYFILLTHLLGSTEYGVFAGAFAFTSLLAPYSSLGMGTVFLRYVGGKPNNLAPYWGNVLMATLSIGVGLTIALTALGSHFLNPESGRLVFLASIANCLCTTLVTECARIFQCAEQMNITAILTLSTNALRVLTVGGFLVIAHRSTAWEWTVASVSVSVLAALAAVISVLYRFGYPEFQPGLLRKRAWEGFGFSFATSTSSIYNDVDKTMLSHYGMNFANGIYTTAYRIIDFATIPVYAARDASIPKLFRTGGEGAGSVARVGRKLLTHSFAISIVMSMLLIASAPLIPHIVGPGFEETVSAIRWLALIPAIRSIHQATGTVLMVSGHQNVRTFNQLAAALFNCVLNLWLIPKHGWIGAAWASLATDGLLACVNWSTMRALALRRPVAAII